LFPVDGLPGSYAPEQTFSDAGPEVGLEEMLDSMRTADDLEV